MSKAITRDSKLPKGVKPFSPRRSVHKEPETPPELRAQQQFKDECDINRIVANAQRGIPPRFLSRGEPHYGDFSNTPDLAEAYNTIQRANQAFMNLPAQLRLELGNDPANISRLTQDQVERYKLGRTLPPVADPALSGGQPQPGNDPAKGSSGKKSGGEKPTKPTESVGGDS